MNWLRRFLPWWRVSEENLTRELTKIFEQTGPIPFLELEERVLNLCDKFGIRHGAVFLSWVSHPHIRTRHQRECGEIICIVRIVTFKSRHSTKEVLRFHAKRMWYARVRVPTLLCAKYKFVEGAPFVGPVDGWERTPIEVNAPDQFLTSLEDILHEQVSRNEN